MLYAYLFSEINNNEMLLKRKRLSFMYIFHSVRRKYIKKAINVLVKRHLRKVHCLKAHKNHGFVSK